MLEMVMLRVASGQAKPGLIIIIISALKVSTSALNATQYYNIEWLVEPSSGAVVVIALPLTSQLYWEMEID